MLLALAARKRHVMARAIVSWILAAHQETKQAKHDTLGKVHPMLVGCSKIYNLAAKALLDKQIGNR